MKHGPRTILLKLLTILLSGSPYQWWTRQQVTAGSGQVRLQQSLDNGHVQRLLRATSAKIAALAGTSQFKIFVMVNIKKFPRGIYESGKVQPWDREATPDSNLDQVISCGIRRRPSSGRAPDPGLKQQASSFKRQATSSKHQATSL